MHITCSMFESVFASWNFWWLLASDDAASYIYQYIERKKFIMSQSLTLIVNASLHFCPFFSNCKILFLFRSCAFHSIFRFILQHKYWHLFDENIYTSWTAVLFFQNGFLRRRKFKDFFYPFAFSFCLSMIWMLEIGLICFSMVSYTQTHPHK